MLESERFLPASARLSYALLKADGFTEDPMASMESIRSTGMPKASQAELTDAYTMMQTAGRTDPEVANSPMYQQVSMTINGQYAQTQSERGAKIVKELSDADTFEIALLENIQRQDLNAVEEADAYKRLIGEFGHTQDALAKLVHKSRSHIANLLRLLDLPESIQTLLVEGKIDMGHARA